VTDGPRILLDNPAPESRRRGAQQIGSLRGQEATTLLLRALGDEDWRVRKEAAAVARAIDSREETVLALVEALDEKQNVGLRNAAVEALVSIGTDVVPAAISALVSLDADGRKLAVEVLGGVPDPQGTTALVDAMSDIDPNVRCAAAEALGAAAAAGERARDQAIEALVAALSSEESTVKLAALDALARLDAKLAWNVYEPLVSDPMLRRGAIAAAARSQDPRAVGVLGAAVADHSEAVARDALVALVECVVLAEGSELIELAASQIRAAPVACERIRKYAHSDDARLRGAALVGLGLIRQLVDIPVLAEALVDEEVAERAEIGLGLFGKEAVPPLLEVGRTSRPSVRATTISLVPVLSAVGDTPTLDALHLALNDSSLEVVAAAIKAMAASGAARDLLRLAPFVKHDDPRIASTAGAAVRSLASRHPAQAKELRASIPPIGSDDAIVGCLLLTALAEGDSGAKLDATDVRFLRAAIANDDARTRRAAVEALAAIGGDASAESVALAVADEESDVSLAAIRALGRMGYAEPLANLVASSRDGTLVATALRALSEANHARAFDAARSLVRSRDALVASAAVEAIGALREPRRDDALFDALEHPEAEVVKSALLELAKLPDARSLARLGLCLDHDSWEVRRVAAEVLGQEGSEPARALLRARLEREKDALVREAVSAALSTRTSGGEVG
jgi:HEAT repeat protein